MAPVLVTADFNETVHLNSDRIKFQTKDPTDVRVQMFTFATGDRTGWHHHHPGFVPVMAGGKHHPTTGRR